MKAIDEHGLPLQYNNYFATFIKSALSKEFSHYLRASDERPYCLKITLCFLDNSIYHKICVLTCGRIISAPTRLCKKEKTAQFCTVLVGADDGARTRYLHLGKVALYQMSYIRILLVPPGGIEPPTRGFSVPCSTD